MRSHLPFALVLMAAVHPCHAIDNIAREVPHELLLVRGYTVFDWLAYRVDRTKVTLIGAVVRPELKRDAENAVRKIEGVDQVENDIELLPDSISDDRIRNAVLRTINEQLVRYQLGAVQSLHIIVKNGSVTLEGEVFDQVDKERAGLLAWHSTSRA
ncbi:MAG: BON domain-containing protein [Bryobacteraceae bacterium]